MPLNAGQTFAGYRIERLLGSGGMGEVYLAEHPRLPRRDALKVLRADVSSDPDYRARFNREADLASTLWHPHIVSVHDRGEYNGQLWIAMDYVEGLDAARLLASRCPEGMPLDQVVKIITAVASALDYAHKQGLLHRDIKPANIMLTHVDHDDDEQRILLADFGIARNVDDISGLTVTNMTVGTVAYSAPEQLLGEEIDGRADQYALAATAYHLLTGSQLFPHSNPAVVISHQLNTPPPALADSKRELADLDQVLSVALAKDPGDRFPRCSDFARALAGLARMDGDPQQGAPTMPALAPRQPADPQPSSQHATPETVIARASRHLWTLALATAAVIVLVVAILFVWRPWQHHPPSSSATSTSSVQPPNRSASSGTPSPLPTPAVFPASAIETLLLSPGQVRTVTGGEFYGIAPGSDMIVSSSSYGMSDNAGQVDPPTCVGVIFGADHSVYNGTGYQEIRDQTLDPSSYTVGHQVEQTVVVFTTAEQAQAVLESQTKQWRACASLPSSVPGTAGLQVGQRHGEGGYTWTLANVATTDSLTTVKMAGYDNEAGSDQACQQALGARDNVVVKIKACQEIHLSMGSSPIFTDTSAAGDYGARLAKAMLDKVKV
ncbi:hypothetical protein A5712_00330 [Mycobacterium sp. E2327]|uniref:serine/threonine-protein kinase PknH/PknJ n=1 Tax=Mycobacterium sp. E2327 TaxID=1834132 RepID=UPI0007FCC3C9|nr:serine/threonine-protein kinase PknH/PknJ [Mycobacterium sp. E2327]OBI18303.1 hypothetical protein A5712_00330 [Mycobacterium sp. E2327]